jgi:hypothetical protein
MTHQRFFMFASPPHCGLRVRSEGERSVDFSAAILSFS